MSSVRDGVLRLGVGEIVRDSLTLKVEISSASVRLFKFRLWLGALVLKLAARIIGCGIEIKGPSA